MSYLNPSLTTIKLANFLTSLICKVGIIFFLINICKDLRTVLGHNKLKHILAIRHIITFPYCYHYYFFVP